MRRCELYQLQLRAGRGYCGGVCVRARRGMVWLLVCIAVTASVCWWRFAPGTEETAIPIASLNVTFESSAPGDNWRLEVSPKTLGGYQARLLLYSRNCGNTVSRSTPLTLKDFKEFLAEADLASFRTKANREVGLSLRHEKDCVSLVYTAGSETCSLEGYAELNPRVLSAAGRIVDRCSLSR